MTNIHPRLQETIDALWLVDTHEHLEVEENRLKRDLWDLFFHHYATTDLVSSGMPYAHLYPLHDPQVSMEEKWKLISPYWKLARYTAMGRTLIAAARDIYGVPDINDATADELMAAFRRENKLGFYEKVLRQMSRIEVAIQDSGPIISDPRYFVNVDRLDRFTGVRCQQDLQGLKDYGGWDIRNLDDLEAAMHQFFQAAVKRKVVGIKCALAYYQPLDFPATRAQAEADLQRMRQTSFPPEMLPMVPHGKQDRHLTNYLMPKALKLVADAGLPFVIHTGYLEGLGNILSNADAEKLIPQFRAFPNLRFVLYHANYPFWPKAGVLAKTYANVWVDLCFVHVLSEEIYRNVLREHLEVVPVTKLFAFGADYKIAEGTYVQQKLVRRSVAAVLQEKIDRGFYGVDEACFVARRILRDNALEFYGLRR